jgi:hypothetical protein
MQRQAEMEAEQRRPYDQGELNAYQSIMGQPVMENVTGPSPYVSNDMGGAGVMAQQPSFTQSILGAPGGQTPPLYPEQPQSFRSEVSQDRIFQGQSPRSMERVKGLVDLKSKVGQQRESPEQRFMREMAIEGVRGQTRKDIEGSRGKSREARASEVQRHNEVMESLLGARDKARDKNAKEGLDLAAQRLELARKMFEMKKGMAESLGSRWETDPEAKAAWDDYTTALDTEGKLAEMMAGYDNPRVKGATANKEQKKQTYLGIKGKQPKPASLGTSSGAPSGSSSSPSSSTAPPLPAKTGVDDKKAQAIEWARGVMVDAENPKAKVPPDVIEKAKMILQAHGLL